MRLIKTLRNNDWYLFVLVLFLSVVVTILTTKISVVIGIVAILFAIAIPIAYIMLTDLKTGFLILIVYSFFLFLISRLSPVPLPTGILVDLIIVILFVSIFLRPSEQKSNGWKRLKHPLSAIILILLLYDLIQAFNPDSHNILAWVDGMRETAYLVLVYVIFSHAFDSYLFFKRFTYIWFYLILAAAIYSIRQEIFGFLPHEWDYIYREPDTYKLIYQWGHFRKFSFLSDVSNAGMTMSFGALFAYVFLFADNRMPIRHRVGYFIILISMLLAMNFSGTRTATAMFVFGIVFYSILTMNKWKTIVTSSIVGFMFVALIFGPFYGNRIQRIRSTFFPSKDNSMGVRDYNRTRIQPYIRSHPMGGGINMADIPGLKFAPSHTLAGLPTDSGYLTVAVERGYLGLIIQLILYGYVMIVGVKNFFKARSVGIKTYYCGYLTCFFALSLANFTQSAMDQKPLYIILIALFVIIVRLIEFDEVVLRKELIERHNYM